MSLPLDDILTLFTPPSVYYRKRLAAEIQSGEPELALLAELMSPRGTKIGRAHV